MRWIAPFLLCALLPLGCASTRTRPVRLDGSPADQGKFAADKTACMTEAGLPETRLLVTTYAAAAEWHRKEAVAGDCMHARGWTLRPR